MNTRNTIQIITTPMNDDDTDIIINNDKNYNNYDDEYIDEDILVDEDDDNTINTSNNNLFNTPIREKKDNSKFYSSPTSVAEYDDLSLSPRYSSYEECKHQQQQENNISRLSYRLSLSPRNQIGSSWSVEMISIKNCGSVYEAIICLRNVKELLNGIDKGDRLKFCKADLDNACKVLKSQNNIWCSELSQEISQIYRCYFNTNRFDVLPEILLFEILLWLPIDDFSPISSVCKDWSIIAVSDEIWNFFYCYKFLRHNPFREQLNIKKNAMKQFQSRLADPCIGDKVEVAWRGRFRLEAMDIYQGLAWWVAEVVDKHVNQHQKKYKVRYPGWDVVWDEWVPRSRLRWAVDSNTVQKINSNDYVELWCYGANVPGVWLESKVKKVRNGKYCIGKVLSSGSLWVERERLRLTKRPSNVITDTEVVSPEPPPRRSITSTIRSGQCSIM